MCTKLESLSGNGEKASPDSGAGGQGQQFSAKQKNIGKKIRPKQLLFSTHPAPRMALVRRLLGS